MKILLPVDSCAHTDRATRHVIAMAKSGTHQVMLINVQPLIDAPELRSHLPAHEVEAMQEARGGDALKSARALLDQAGVAYTPSVMVGPVAETIAKFAADQACELIVMGTRSAGTLQRLVMGSLTTSVIHLTDRPVTIVK